MLNELISTPYFIAIAKDASQEGNLIIMNTNLSPVYKTFCYLKDLRLCSDSNSLHHLATRKDYFSKLLSVHTLGECPARSQFLASFAPTYLLNEHFSDNS
jgi:hypothetical protein